MIPIKDLLYDIDLKLNKVGTNEHQNIPLEDKLVALNDAQINLIKTKYSENNLYKAGLDSFQKRYNDLETLVESEKTLTPKKSAVTNLNRWEVNLEDLSPEYMLGIPGTEYILADKGSCKSRIVVIDLVKHGDVKRSLENTNTNPSFEYQQTIGTISDHKYEIYTDGTFTPKKFGLSYIRYPRRVDFEGYTHFDGKPSVTTDSELPSYLKEELVDLAVRNLALSTENQGAVQSSTIRLKEDE